MGFARGEPATRNRPPISSRHFPPRFGATRGTSARQFASGVARYMKGASDGYVFSFSYLFFLSAGGLVLPLPHSSQFVRWSRVRASRMADHQRVYPAAADEEKSMRPTAPLAPKASFSSENGDPRAYDSNRRAAAAMPAQQPPAPRYFSKPPPRRNPCCCCLGWLFSFLFVVISIVAVAALVIFLVFQPRIPKYSVEGIRITNFEPNLADSSVSSQFVVEIRARNPNKKIGIYYKEDSHLAVSYTGTELCSGKLPAFYQGHKNTTVLEVTLTGTNVHLSNQLLSTLQTQQQESSIPLNIKADVPVKIKMGSWKSWKVTFHVRCRLTVDSLSSTKSVSIKSKHCKVKVKV